MKKRLVMVGLIILGAVFFRVFRIGVNGHFHSDEARDLVNIHQIWVEKKITLVGPISDDGSYLFSSLTYYLLLPFAVIFNFEPIGTIVGAIFWGLVTFGCFWLLAIKTNPKMLVPAGILAAVWWPLVQTSRWPWNPNFVPLWIALSLLLSFFKKKIFKLFAGLAGGLALHHHFLAIVSLFFVWLKERKLLWLLGFGLTVLPFFIFDLRHPPGLFWSRMVMYNNRNSLPKLADIVPKMIEAVKFTSNYMFSGGGLAIIIGLVILGLFIWDIKNKSKGVYWGLSVLLSLGMFLVYSNQSQYLLGSLGLFWMWLFSKRTKLGHNLMMILVGLICLSSVIEAFGQFYTEDYKSNPRLMTGASKIIKEQIEKQDLKNPNLAVLGSPDQDRSGKAYRDILLTWNIRLKGPNELLSSDNLFVISQQQVNNLKGDGASEIDGFRQGVVIGDWEIEGTNWRVVQFNRY